MKDSIFRKASLDRVSSPEQLNDYIRVARPSVWMILGAIVALLIGVIVWSIVGRIDGIQDVYKRQAMATYVGA